MIFVIIFLIALVYVIILAIVSAFDFSSIVAFEGWDAFINSWYGIVAIVTGILAVFLFWASGRSFVDVKIKETFLPRPEKKSFFRKLTSIFKNKIAMTNQPVFKGSKVELDLSGLNLKQFQGMLSKQAAYLITKPAPVLFKAWGNRRLELDVERLSILSSYISNLCNLHSEFLNLAVEELLSYEKMESFASVKRTEFRKKEREAELELDLLEDRYASLKADYEYQIGVLTKKLEGIDARINNLKAKTSIIEKASENFDGLTMAQVEALRVIVGSSTTSEMKDELDEDMKEALLRKQQIENDIADIERKMRNRNYRRDGQI